MAESRKKGTLSGSHLPQLQSEIQRLRLENAQLIENKRELAALRASIADFLLNFSQPK